MVELRRPTDNLEVPPGFDALTVAAVVELNDAAGIAGIGWRTRYLAEVFTAALQRHQARRGQPLDEAGLINLGSVPLEDEGQAGDYFPLESLIAVGISDNSQRKRKGARSLLAIYS